MTYVRSEKFSGTVYTNLPTCAHLALQPKQVQRSTHTNSDINKTTLKFQVLEKLLEDVKHLRAGLFWWESTKHQHMGLDLHSGWQQQRHCLMTNSLPFPCCVAGGLKRTCLSLSYHRAGRGRGGGHLKGLPPSHSSFKVCLTWKAAVHTHVFHYIHSS